MEPPPLRDAELRSLVERIKRKDCVLVLGPRVAVRPGDPDRRPLEELLACEILSQTDVGPNEAALSSTNLRRAADLYLRLKRNDRVELELAVQDFYSRDAEQTTDFHVDLAALPFKLCICATPDDLMLHAYEKVGKAPQRGHYNFKEPARETLSAPTPEKPLVYHLFGHHEDPESLVLSEMNLIDFIVAVVKGVPAVPDQVRSILKPDETSFLFLGFGFQHWYLRVLLRVFAIYNRPKLLAFEDAQFFDHPENEEAIGFFSEQQVDFRPLRWDAFAKDLRRVYDAS
ncbi:MAG TPA: SIR2 family protein, partial [Thermoanaerobaculia bacterium]|nr:SIR2 family protein [Thermoanaerobaculia bacterium]